jgi:hypothetical protein
MIADQPGGAQAWAFMQANVESNSALNYDPKWAILPRASSSTPPPTQITCDLNGDGSINAVDVQLAIDQALGKSPCTTADLQKNGRCSVIDVQRVINASFGAACRIGF